MILYDASAFFTYVGRKSVDLNAFILDLTCYEVGNILWKHIAKLKTLSPNDAISPLAIIQNWPNIIPLEKCDMQSVLELATELGLSFYDAAYVFYAKKHNLILHTCVRSLYEKARKSAKIEFMKF